MESGITLLDTQLGGLHPGRLHLLTGAPGTGKTRACLHFLQTGLRKIERVALITTDRTSDLVSHADSMGWYLEEPLRSGQLVLLRFRASFNRLIERAGSPDPMIEELCGLLAQTRPSRVVVDSLTPFLGAQSASASSLSALTNTLEDFGLTALLTYPGDVYNAYDSRLSSVVQNAALIIHLARTATGTNRIHVVQARARKAPSKPTPFVFEGGIVPPPKRTRVRQPKTPI